MTQANGTAKLLSAVDNEIAACRAWGHRWPELVPGKKLPRGFRPLPQRDGCVLAIETCQRCGKERQTLTLPGGIFDTGALRRYRDPEHWVTIHAEEKVTRRDFQAEVWRRLHEDIGLYTVARTGKPRKAVTPTEAVLVVVIDVAIVTLLVLAALRIGA